MDTERAWDWEVTYTLPGPKQCGSLGRTGSRERAEERVNTALRELPDGVPASGSLKLYGALNEHCERRFIRDVASVQRRRDGQIVWIRWDVQADPESAVK